MYRIAGNFRDFKVKVCEIIFAILIFVISNEPTFELCGRINYCGFYFRDSVYSPRNRENKNPVKISRYAVLGATIYYGCLNRRYTKMPIG